MQNLAWIFALGFGLSAVMRIPEAIRARRKGYTIFAASYEVLGWAVVCFAAMLTATINNLAPFAVSLVLFFAILYRGSFAKRTQIPLARREPYPASSHKMWYLI